MTTGSIAPVTIHVWAVCLQASEEARRRGDLRAGTEHLLLALLEHPSIESTLGVSQLEAREALGSLDREALVALGLGSGADAPPLRTRVVPKNPRFREIAQGDRLRLTPAAKRALEVASKPNRRRLQVTAEEVLARILNLEPPDPSAVLLVALRVNTQEVRRRLREVTPDGR